MGNLMETVKGWVVGTVHGQEGARCQYIKSDRSRCERQAASGCAYCWQHRS